MNEVLKLLFPLLGALETYGIRQVISQGYEKLVVDPQRYERIHGTERSFVCSYPIVPKAVRGQRKTVILVAHSYYPDSGGGTERFAKNLASALIKAGDRVFLLAYSARRLAAYPKRCSGIVYAEETVDGIPVIRFRHQRPNKDGLKNIPQGDSALEAFAKELFSRIHPDVVHFLHLSRVSALTGECQKQRIPYFVTVTDFFAVCHSSTRVDRSGRICKGCEEGIRCGEICPTQQVKAPAGRYQNALRLLKGAENVIAPSAYTAGVFQREFPGLEVLVIPHGIGLTSPSCVKKRKVRRFLYIGRLSEVKGVCGLIRAFRNMPEDCTLQIYGNGSVRYKRKLKRLAAGDGRISFYAPVPPEDIQEVYQKADCVVVPSLVPETYNFVVREALQSGCLVVASSVGAIPEAINEGKNGFLVLCGRDEKLLDGLAKAYVFSWEDRTESRFPGIEEEAASYSYLYERSKGE